MDLYDAENGVATQVHWSNVFKDLGQISLIFSINRNSDPKLNEMERNL